VWGDYIPYNKTYVLEYPVKTIIEILWQNKMSRLLRLWLIIWENLWNLMQPCTVWCAGQKYKYVAFERLPAWAVRLIRAITFTGLENCTKWPKCAIGPRRMRYFMKKERNSNLITICKLCLFQKARIYFLVHKMIIFRRKIFIICL
jgi:hypothetical protein